MTVYVSAKKDIKKEDARELFNIDVEEVSIVDKPAILREFLVLKNRRKNMGVFDPDKGEKEPTQEVEGVVDENNSSDEVTKDTAVLKVYGNGDIEIDNEKIEKGKRFTSNRTSSLAKSVQELLQLLASVDVDTTKGIIDDLTKAILPADVKWRSGTTAVGTSGVKKVVDDAIDEKLKDVVNEAIASKFEAFEKRLGVIEETRPESQSKDDSIEEPVKKSIFSGLI